MNNAVVMKEVYGYMRTASGFLQFLAVLALLSVVMCKRDGLPEEEMIGQWVWFEQSVWVSLGFLLLSLMAGRKAGGRPGLSFQACVMWGLALLGGIQALWGLAQHLGIALSGHSRFTVTGSFFNPGPYGGYLAVALPCAVYLFMMSDGRKRSYASGTLMVLILFALPVSMSRSAWMAAMAACMAETFLLWKASRGTGMERRKYYIIIPVAIAVLVGACVLMYHIRPASADGRVLIWMNSLRAIAQRPWTGYGWGNFGGAYGEAQEAYFASGHAAEGADMLADAIGYGFNEYLDKAIRIGVPATLLIVAVLACCLRRSRKDGQYGIYGSLMALMVFSLSSYPMLYPSFVITLGVLVLAGIGRNRMHVWLGVVAVLCIVSAFRLKKDMGTEQACQEWRAASMVYRTESYKRAEGWYVRLYPALKDRAPFLYEYGHTLHKLGKQEESNRILKEALPKSSDPMVLDIIGKNCQAMGQYGEAEHWYLRAANRVPGRIYPYYLLTKLYAEPSYLNPRKFYKMKKYVLEKKAKVDSPGVRDLKEEIRQLELPQDSLRQTGQSK